MAFLGFGDDSDEQIKEVDARANDEKHRAERALDVTGTQNKIAAEQAKLDAQTAPTIQAEQAGQLDTSAPDQTRAGQVTLADILAKRVAGAGPSAAATGSRLASEDALSAAMSRGNASDNAAGAQRAVSGTAAGDQFNAAVQGGNARLAEQGQAQQALATVLGQGREGDLRTADAGAQNERFNATLRQQAAQGNQQAQLQLQEQHNALAQQYIAMGMDANQALAAAYQQIYGVEAGGTQAFQQQSQQQAAQAKQLILGGAMTAAGTAIGGYAASPGGGGDPYGYADVGANPGTLNDTYNTPYAPPGYYQ